MKVSELAAELKTTSDEVLKTLKSLKLKSKDADQELNVVVESLLRSEFAKPKKKETKTAQKAPEKTEKETKTTKKKAIKKTAKKTAKTSEEEPTTKKKTVKKKAVKKTAKKKDESVKADTEEKKNKPKTAKEKKSEDKPKTQEKTAAPKKRKIKREPVITLKPLARKKKRSAAKEDKQAALAGGEPLQTVEEFNEKQTTGTEEEQAAAVEKQPPPRIDSYSDLEIKVPISVKDLSVKIQQKPSVVLAELMKMGIMTNINQGLDADIVGKLTQRFGINLVNIKTQEESLIEAHKQEEEDPKLLKSRAPVITFMGHVDHGKTTLLDRIRKSKIADKEHGGITQHMGAYSVKINKGAITFLDTPGHEAFTSMRARGAHITDLVVLVVAADEGVMPQTIEAVDHARAAKVPIVVALTKMDRPNADLDRVKQQLAKIDLASEDWGGKTVVVGVSAMTGDGVDELLELILLESELLELKANDQKMASGIIVEAHLSQGKGAVSTVIVQSGTLNEGNVVVVGPYYGRIKAMFNDLHQPVKKAGPSMPVEVLGLSSVPEAGDMFYVVADEKQAREITFKRSEELKNEKLHAKQKMTLEGLYSQIEEGVVKELNVIIKSDVQGSLEALKDSLEKIPSDKVRLNFIHLGVGEINVSDIVLAGASKAIIIAFHVGTDVKAKEELKKNPVDIREYRIIYDAVDDIRKALEGLLEAKTKRHFLSRIEIREVFKLSKQGVVAGCYVEKGKVHRKDHIDILRDGEVVYSGILTSLKRFKDDVKEVTEGMECGISIDGFDKFQTGDIIEAYEIEKIAQKL